MKPISKTVSAVTISMTATFGIFGTPAFAHHSPLSALGPSEQTDDFVVVPPSQQTSVWLTSDLATFAATGEQTSGQFSLFDIYAPPQVGTLLHKHDNEDEAFYILEGNVSFQLDDHAFTTTPGSFVYLPKGHPHAWRNLGTTPARVATVTTPSGLERLFEAVGLPVTDKSNPPLINPKILAVAGTKLFGVEAPDQLLFSASQYSFNKDGTPVTPVTILRPAKSLGEVGATLTLSNDNSSATQIPVNFADQQQLQSVSIPINDDGSVQGNETIKLSLTNPTGGTTPVLLYNKAYLTVADKNDLVAGNSSNFLDVQGLYNFPIVGPNPNPQSFLFGNGIANVIGTGKDTEGQFSLFDVSLPSQGLQSYIYPKANQGLFVLDGDVSFQVDNQTFTLTPQTFVYIPKDQPYAFNNFGTTAARFLLIDTSQTSIPEPNLTLGTLAFAAFAAGSLLKKQRKQTN